MSSGQAVKIMTGAAMPAGADAVLPVEQADCETAQVFAIAEVSPGKHVGRQGEDIARGSVVLRKDEEFVRKMSACYRPSASPGHRL